MSLAGKQVGDFRLQGLISQTPGVQSYRAVQDSLNRPVLLRLFDDLPGLLERARAVASLSHPSILPYYAVGSEKDFTYVATRLIEGPTLAELLAAELPLGQALTHLAQLVSGLTHAHLAGVVHGCPTPEKVRIAADQAILCDFEAALLAGDDGRDDPRADIHQLGQLLQDLLQRHPCPDALQPLLTQFSDGLTVELPRFEQSLWAVLSGLDQVAEVVLDKSMQATVIDASQPYALRSESFAPMSHSRFGKYVLEKELGHGGMGIVYKAWQSDLERHVALKMLHQRLMEDVDAVERFGIEARSVASLRHAHLISVFEVGEIDGVHFFTMELVDGADLYQLIESGELTPRRSLEILRDVARGVQHAHEQGIMHRDLKPENILVEHGSGRPMVADFGLAKQLGEGGRALTATGAILGTPIYMSPEQARADTELIDHRTDVYSLGAVLYHMLTGASPFPSGDPMMVVLQVAEADPRPPRVVQPALHVDAETICLKAMEKSPARRYQSAAELADDIERFLEGRPIQAVPNSRAYLIWRALIRQRSGLLAAACTLVLVLVGLALTTGHRERQAFDRFHEQARVAEQAERWGDAIQAGERALELRGADAQLRALVVRAKAALRARQQRRARRIAEGDRYRELQETILQPLADRIKLLRPFFYMKNIDIRKKLREVAVALQKLRQHSRDPRYARSPGIWRLLGMGCYFLGDLDAAQAALERALALSPDDPWSNAYIGRVYLERWQMAILLRRGSQENAASLERYVKLALHHIDRASGKWADAAPLDRHVLLAYRALAANDTKRVRQLFEEGLKRFAGELGREQYWVLRGVSSPAEQAIKSYTRALEIRPHYAWAYLIRGTLRSNLGRQKLALGDLNQALALSRGVAEGYFTRANIRSKLKDPGGALSDYGEALRLDPQMVEAYVYRAVVLLQLKRHKAALADLERAIELRPKASMAYLSRGNVYLDLGDLVRAHADYEMLVKLDPANLAGYLNRGRTHELSGRYRLAIEDYTQLLERDPREVRGWVNRGSCYIRLGEMAPALRDTNRAIRLAPRDGVAHMNRGIIRLNLKQQDAALADLNLAVRYAPDDPMTWYTRGDLKLGRRDLSGAVADFDQAIRLNPRYTSAYTNRAVARMYAKQYVKAEPDLTQAIKLAPQQAAVWYNRAQMWHARGETERAIADYTRTLELDANQVDALSNRALLFYGKQQLKRALRDYEEALRRAPANWPSRKAVQDFVGQLKKRKQ